MAFDYYLEIEDTRITETERTCPAVPFVFKENLVHIYSLLVITFKLQNYVSVASVSKVEKLRECLRSLKRSHKVNDFCSLTYTQMVKRQKRCQS